MIIRGVAHVDARVRRGCLMVGRASDSNFILRCMRPVECHVAKGCRAGTRTWRVQAVQFQAHADGLFAGPHTSAEPPRSAVIVADGTVPKVRFKSSTYKEMRNKPRVNKNGDRRSLPDARVHTEGGGVTVIGEKHVVMSARVDSTPNTRVILDVRHCTSTDPAGEAKVAVEAALELRERAPGITGLIYDGAFRSVNIDPLIKAGMTVLSPRARTRSAGSSARTSARPATRSTTSAPRRAGCASSTTSMTARRSTSHLRTAGSVSTGGPRAATSVMSP